MAFTTTIEFSQADYVYLQETIQGARNAIAALYPRHPGDPGLERAFHLTNLALRDLTEKGHLVRHETEGDPR
jgi:hypothetical protein